jgi:hypothetical protein
MWREIYHEFRRWAKVSDRAVAPYKRTEITVETDRVWIIRKSHSTRVWCEKCGREVEMVGLREAAALSGVGQPVLLDTDGRDWHRTQAPDGSPLICLESLRLR